MLKKAKALRVTTKAKLSPEINLIVGLGNPGPKYTRTRHNAGFLVVDELARRADVDFRAPRFRLRKSLAEEAKTDTCTLIKPTTFMNLSGGAVQAYAAKLRLKPENILLIHDDLDLPLGRLRFRVGGSGGGQRGVGDTIDRIGPDFVRLKIGIGRPPEGWKVEKWVLAKFREEESALLAQVITAATDAVDTLLALGLEPAMQRYNGTDLRPQPDPSAP